MPPTDRMSSPSIGSELTGTQELSCEATAELAPVLGFQFHSQAEQTIHDMVWAEVAHERPARRWRSWLLLVGSLGLFVAAGTFSLDPRTLATLAGILVLHELGHFLAMKAFGYRDVKLFFVPFLGAAVSGAKHAAPAWQKAVVILMGPLPGLILGSILYLVLRDPSEHGLGLVALGLVLLNGMNLVPVEPFDGGKLAHLVAYSRNPSVELFFVVLAGAFCAGLGALGGHWAIVLVAAVLLIGAWPRHVRAVRALEVRRLRPRMPTDLTALNSFDKLILFRQAVRMTGGAGFESHPWPNPAAAAAVVRTLHGAVAVRPPGFGVSAFALAGWLLGIALAAGVLALWSHDRTTVHSPPIRGKTAPNTP